MTISFFEKLNGIQRERAQATVASYHELVAGIATGDEPNPNEVEHLLEIAGKSVDELRQDVDRFQHRMALKAMAASLPKLEIERREIDKQIAAADRVLDAAEKEHDDVTAPLYASHRDLDLAMSEASRASNELVQLCDDADLRNEMTKLDSEIARSYEQLRVMTDRATFMEQKAQQELDRAAHEIMVSEADHRRDVASRYKIDADAVRREQKRLAKHRTDLENRREKLEQRMREI